MDQCAPYTLRSCSHTVWFLFTRMDHVDLNIAVFTNLATDAAEEGDFEELLEAQGAIFRRLTDPTTQRAIINLDGTTLAPVLQS